MNRHQIIYTMCRRGINGTSDGQQVFSYDATFTANDSDVVRGLFKYQIPSLPTGVIMTDALAKTMPSSFTYRRLNSSMCAVALNTYLGRDYMQGGRFGNYLSHAIIYDESELNYPCEYYESSSFRTYMDENEVRAAERPAFLPDPKLSVGDVVSRENIGAFLSDDDGRVEILKKMVSSMISFKRTKKRIVICDTKENIIMWIAAIHYTLPLRVALNVNFTTYEYDPALSISQICGVVVEGTRYNAHDINAHYVFDLTKGIVPPLNTDGDFFDFVDVGLTISPRSICSFQKFVVDKLTYSDIDEDYYNVYLLYCIFTEGLENVSRDMFDSAVRVLNGYAKSDADEEFASKLVGESQFIQDADDDYALVIIKSILSCFDSLSDSDQESIKEIIVKRCVATFAADKADERSFLRLYNTIASIAKSYGIKIPRELLKANNQKTLLNSMERSKEQWKWVFIVDLLNEYFVEEKLSADELLSDRDFGRLVGDIITARVARDETLGFQLIQQFIDKFDDSWEHLFLIGSNAKEALLRATKTVAQTGKLWNRIFDVIHVKHLEKKALIYKFLLENKQYDVLLQMFDSVSRLSRNAETARDLFRDQLLMVDSNKNYAKKAEMQIYEMYYNFLEALGGESVMPYARELLNVSISNNIQCSCIDELVLWIAESIPLGKPNESDNMLIKKILDYSKGKQLDNRLLLFAVGNLFSRANTSKDLVSIITAVTKLTKGKGAIVARIDGDEVESYFEWFVPNIWGIANVSSDIVPCYQLFKHSTTSSVYFVGICADEVVSDIKNDKELKRSLMLLDFVFRVGKDDDFQIVGEYIREIGKQKIEKLDALVKKAFTKERASLNRWRTIYEVATTKTNRFANLFKGRTK